MLRPALVSLWLVLALTVSAAPPLREAAHPEAAPANQLAVAGNACGPAALLNAFRFGSDDWRRASDALAGDTDRQRMLAIIRDYGMRPSQHLAGRARWSKKGVNLADLTDIANDMTRGKFLPQVGRQVLFLDPGESHEKLLKRVHRQLDTSLAKGLPPVVSLRRYLLRKGQWQAADAHFVTLTALPRKLEKGARSFPVTYVDPWGGKICQGSIAIPTRAILAATAEAAPCLEAVFPQASVGKKLVRPGEPSAIAVAGVLGRW